MVSLVCNLLSFPASLSLCFFPTPCTVPSVLGYNFIDGVSCALNCANICKL